MGQPLAPPVFFDLIADQARRRPHKPAVIFADRIVTYGMFAQAVASIDARLASSGLATGDLVCLSLSSTVRHLAFAVALARRGLPFVALSHAGSARSLGLKIAAHVQDPGAELIVGARQIIADETWFAPSGPDLSRVAAQGDAIFTVYLSSGTTGVAKPVSTTLDDFTRSIGYYQYVIDGGQWDRMLCALSVQSAWGLMLSLHALTVGKTIVCADSARDCLQMIAAFDVDFLCASTRQMRELLAAQSEGGFIACPSLKALMTGGSLIPAELMMKAQASLCRNIISIYGATETGCNAIALPEQTHGQSGGSGFTTPWTQIEIADDEGATLPAGSEGAVRMRSTTTCSPYPPGRKDLDAVFRDGWFYPGDRGYFKPDGMLVLVGRKDEILNSGGVKLAPETIETALHEHAAVKEAGAFGMMANDGVEEIAAAVVPRGPFNERQIIDWMGARGIPLARVYVVDALPVTPSGKLHRAALRQKFA